jgi:hypothetical protein
VPRSLPQEYEPRCPLASYRREIRARTRLSWSATRSTWPLPNLPGRQPGPKPAPPLAQHGLRSFEHQAPTRAADEPLLDTAGDHANPGHSNRAAACPTAALHDLTPVGHSGHGKARTPDAHTGRRTPGRSDARTGHWTPVA